MAGRIKQEDIEAVRERIDIVKLVSQYLTLKKAGGDNMTGLCPFHQEKTPSFSVSPGKQVFFCHGCGKGGDAIGFLRELEHLGFAEAVERLAQQAGVTLRYEGDSPAERRAAARRIALIKANEEAARLFASMLAEGREAEEARAYVADRGISAESVERFGIGYAPGYPDFLLKRMTREFSPEILLEAGLATRGDDGSAARRPRSHPRRADQHARDRLDRPERRSAGGAPVPGGLLGARRAPRLPVRAGLHARGGADRA